MYLHIPLFVPPCTILYHLVPPCTTLHCAGTRQYIPVHTSMYCLGIFYVGTYWYVPFWGFLHGLVSSKVRTGSYQYIPSWTALYQVYRIPDVWNLARLRYRSHGLQVQVRNRSMNRVLYMYIPMSESPNFDIMMEALHSSFDFDIGPDIGLRYWSPSPLTRTSISKYLSLFHYYNFDIDLEVFRLRYWSTSILKILRYRSKLRYRSNPISKITSISKLKFIYGYRSFVLQYLSDCDIVDLRYRRSLISKLSLILSGPARAVQGSGKRMQAAAQNRSR